MKVVIVPGNGDGNVEECNWYGWLCKKLSQSLVELHVEEATTNCEFGLPVIKVVARESIWLPFMENVLRCDEHTIIVGHSSGAEAAMRYAEKHKVHGIVLVSACITDLGDASEAASGYYNHPWEWEKMKDNTQWIVQYGSTDDPFIPFQAEQQQVATNTESEFHKYNDQGHFIQSTFPDLLKLLMKKIKN